ncbi:MAG TPA: cation diffusion facilitator family transporter [Alphaproteobacteria bacterium]|nr:cation diffusion facilitator family transporter [Alphaproteobacteria bacterium]
MSDPSARATGVPSPAQARLMRTATYASVSVAAVLILAKLAAFLATDSVALLSSLIDSLLDAAASVVNLYAVSQALVPADREHRFGHGKAEALAGLGQSAFIAGSAVFLLFEAGHRLIDVHPVKNGTIGIAVMLFSLAATLALVLFQRMVVRRTGSIAVGADALHYFGDVLVNGSVIIALLLGPALGWYALDPLFAIGIAIYIVVSAWSIARRSLDQLMDHELSDEARRRIVAVATAHRDVVALHDLRTRAAGTRQFIQFHLEMDPGIRLARAHEIADEVEAALLAEFPGAEVIIHEDPAGIDEPHRAVTG